jgi:hypothetical protein
MVQPPGSQPPTGTNRPAEAAFQPDAPLLRFGLRQLLFFVAGLSALLAALVSVRGAPALALLLASMVVAFHVFGTALGSRLRRHANRGQALEAASTERRSAGAAASDGPAQQPVLEPPSLPWYGRSGASFAWLPRLVAASVFFGGCLGAVSLTVATGHRTSPAGLVVAAVSLAALSGWFAFLGGSFVGIVRGGLNEVAQQDAINARPSIRK